MFSICAVHETFYGRKLQQITHRCVALGCSTVSGFDFDKPILRFVGDVTRRCDVSLALRSDPVTSSGLTLRVKPSGRVSRRLGLCGNLSSGFFLFRFFDEKARRSSPFHSSVRGSTSPSAVSTLDDKSTIERPPDILGTSNSILAYIYRVCYNCNCYNSLYPSYNVSSAFLLT